MLMVARGPFVEAGGGHFAYVVRDGVAERRPIRTGATSVDAVEILAGAKEGDQVVVAGTDAFDNAERVRIAATSQRHSRHRTKESRHAAACKI